YLDNPERWKENLIRFSYADRQDMFDVVTYQKGGRILNMLRHYLGNEAFHKGLHLYLTAHAFGTADAQQLRLAMEEASGLDLNWFFNEWFYGAGHPVLDISYRWDEAAKTESVYLKQSQDGQTFIIPMAVDIYAGGQKTRYKVWMHDRTDTLTFHLSQKPDLVNMEAEKALICKKTDHKTLAEFAFQYAHAPLYLDRGEAIDAAAANQTDSIARRILLSALNDRYYGLRIKAMQALDLANKNVADSAAPVLLKLVATDTNNLARAAAIETMAKLNVPGAMDIFKQTLAGSTSYAVQGAALNAILQIDPKEAFVLAHQYEKDSKGALRDAIITLYCQNGGDNEWSYIYYNFADPGSPVQYRFTGRFADLAGKVPNPAFAKQGINAIVNLVIELRKYGSLPTFIKILERVKAARLKLSDTASAAYVDAAIAKMKAAQ
ncbi:MAG: HEAT repeat domain-containing protein, partial [Bacteroidetes bacterium]|nr:HEAT repeat domain-containing protein [Bacteroidota bacterium]